MATSLALHLIKSFISKSSPPLSSRFYRSAQQQQHLVQASCNMMTSSLDTPHIERTESSYRQKDIIPCRVTSIRCLSPSVKHYQLKPLLPFTFKPGQWVDVFIPGTDAIGGYSMCSAPAPNPSDKKPFELAIKYSNHIPTAWMHESCAEGMKLNVRVGGDVFLDDITASQTQVVLLVAAGIGINPLLSIMRSGVNHPSTRYHLIYTAKSLLELIFKEDIDLLSTQHNISVQYNVTDESESPGKDPKTDDKRISYSRLTLEEINDVIRYYLDSGITKENMRCYICGPPPMIDELSETLLIKPLYEKWW